MLERIGRFEIASQLAQSAFATVYKAVDSESQQTVALKVVDLGKVKDRAGLMKLVFEEAEQAKPLSSHNIAALYGVGDEGNLLLASMEYVQGNSVATTLERHDGFSIWDFQDIARQVCQALDHAQGHRVVHQSLEPAKIMVQWDGMVKILGFGSSALNSQSMELSGAVPDMLHYASPEQLRGEKCDHRSALFSLGAVLYEMLTEQNAFAGETPEQVRSAILETAPPMPHRLKSNINPALSALIMKAIAKSPDERYQSGQDLVHDLEQCRAGKTATPAATPAPAKAAAAAGVASGVGQSSSPTVKASAAPGAAPRKPRFAVDPMMAEPGTGAAKHSFSEISELPPLKEVYVAPPPPPETEPEIVEPTAVLKKPIAAEKPAVQVREAAQKAARAIRRTPPKLYFYAVGSAVFLIALYLAGMAFYNYIEDNDNGGNAAATAPAIPPVQPQTSPATQSPAPQNPDTDQTAAAQTEQPDTSETALEQPEEPVTRGRAKHGKGKHLKAGAATAAVSGELTILSTPAGAQVSFDGSELCQTPCTLTGIAPGQHTVMASKSGYAASTRNLAMASGGNSSVSFELSSLGSGLSVASAPAGAVILIDGKDTGKLTPSKIAISKPGTHTVTLQKVGYLDQSSTVNVETGQTSSVNLTLTHLGDTEEIRSAGGRFKKVFGRGGDTAGMGIVSIKTQPKGAQIMINNRVLEKTTPFDFYLNPGTYVVDITMSGYKGVHRVINVQEGEKLAIQETLSTE